MVVVVVAVVVVAAVVVVVVVVADILSARRDMMHTEFRKRRGGQRLCLRPPQSAGDEEVESAPHLSRCFCFLFVFARLPIGS